MKDFAHCKHNGDSYESMLSSYASGSLDEALSLLVASHASISKDARDYINDIETLCGSLLESQDVNSCEFNDALIDKTLKEIDTKRIVKDSTPAKNKVILKDNEEAALPAVLRNHILNNKTKAKTRAKWQKAAPGIHFINIPLKSSCKSVVQLIKIAPGKTTPTHSHEGTETTLVLDGAFEDESGTYVVGDIIIADKTTKHTPKAHSQMGCICMAVTDAPLRFTGLLGPVLNLFSKF